MGIEIRNVNKNFGAFRALDDVTLHVPEGELVALLGPSGSGKTTLLRILAGLEAPDSGGVLYQESDITRRAPRDRNVGFVFQHYALFSHMNIFENVAFGLRVRGVKGDRVRERVHELLRLVQLEGLEKRFPSQLSGGQRQRIALARALAAEPKVLLLDEPFGALDARVRQDLRRWLRRLHDEIHTTSVFVTHDQEEAFEVADRVVVMNHGRIEQVGSPEELFAHPANAFVMDFMGSVNVFHGRVQSGYAQVGDVRIPYPEYPHDEPQPAAAYVRPHELDVQPHDGVTVGVEATVVRINRSGPLVRLSLAANEDNTPIDVDLDHARSQALGLSVGDVVTVAPREARVFLRETEPALAEPGQ